MSAVSQLSTKPHESNVGISETPQTTPETMSYMVSPHVSPDQEADIAGLVDVAVRKYPGSAYPDQLGGGVWKFYRTYPARAFMNLLEVQGFAYDMTFLPGEP